MNGCALHNADCMDILPSLADGSVDLLCTDPPYGVDFKSDKTAYDDSKSRVFSLVPVWFSEWFRVLKDGSWAFVFTGTKNINLWINEAERAGFTYKNILATRSFNRGRMCFNNFVFETQPVVCLTKGTRGRAFNCIDFFPTSQDWLKDPRNRNPKPYSYAYSNWIPSEICYGTETFGSARGHWHPNAKSERLIRFLIEIATDVGGTVLDPFAGCGTTGAAALSAGRRFVGVEIDPRWCRVAGARLAGKSDWRRRSPPVRREKPVPRQDSFL